MSSPELEKRVFEENLFDILIFPVLFLNFFFSKSAFWRDDIFLANESTHMKVQDLNFT